MIRQRVFSSVSSTPCAHLIFLISIKVAKKISSTRSRSLCFSIKSKRSSALRNDLKFVPSFRFWKFAKEERKKERTKNYFWTSLPAICRNGWNRFESGFSSSMRAIAFFVNATILRSIFRCRVYFLINTILFSFFFVVKRVKINGAEFGEIFGFKQTIKIDLNEKTRVREWESKRVNAEIVSA